MKIIGYKLQVHDVNPYTGRDFYTLEYKKLSDAKTKAKEILKNGIEHHMPNGEIWIVPPHMVGRVIISPLTTKEE